MTGSAISTSAASPPQPAPARLRGVLAGLSLAMLLPSLGTSVANVALPTLEEAFGASYGEVRWVVLAYLLAVTTLVVGAGRLGDLVGRRRLLLAGVTTFTLGSAACVAAPALWALIAARALQGAGAAAMMALTLAFVAEAVPGERTGGAMGLLGSTSAVGTALGPSLGGVLTAWAGWRAIFLVNIPLGLAAVHLVHRHLPADPRRPGGARRRLSPVGTLLMAVTLAAYALAMTTGDGRPGALAAALLLVAAGAGGLLVLVERRSDVPLVGWSALRDPGLRRGLLASGVVSTVMMATLVVGPFHLARGLGLDATAVGLAMSVGPAVVVLAGIPAGRITDRLGAGRVTVAGLVSMAGGTLLLSLMPIGAGVPGYVGPIVVVTLGYALFQTANNAAVMAGAPPDLRGVTSGMLNLSRNLGLITGASLLGAVFALAAGTSAVASAPPGDVAAGMRVTFMVAFVLIVGAIVAARRSTRADRSARDS